MADENASIHRTKRAKEMVVHLYLQSVNTQKDPCRDFYSYVCNGFGHPRKTNVIDSVNSWVSRKVHKKFMEVSATREHRKSARHKARRFYDSCVSRTLRINKKGNRDALISFMKKAKLSLKDEYTCDLLDRSLMLVLRYNIQVFFGLGVASRGLSADDDKLTVLHLIPSTEMARWREIRWWYVANGGEYNHLVREVLQASTTVIDNETDGLISAVKAAEAKVFDIWSTELSPDYADLARHYAENWTRPLKKHSNGRLIGNYAVNFLTKEFLVFHKTASNLSSFEAKVYLIWEVSRQLASISGLLHTESKSQTKDFCYATTMYLYKDAVILPFMISVMDRKRVSGIQAMAKNIQDHIVSSIRRLHYPNSSYTKVELTKIVKTLRFNFGYPFTKKDSSRIINEHFKRYTNIRGPFLASFLAASKAYALQFIRAVTRKARKPSYPDFDSVSIGSFYQAPNTMHVTAASMLEPLFHSEDSPEINYGALGSILSHEVVRSFIGNGKIAEGNEAFLDWSKSIAVANLSCHAETADSSGTRDAEWRLFLYDSMASQALFMAYKAAASRSLVRVGGLEDFTRDQLFFISRCFYTCASKPHTRKAKSLEQRRCNFAVRNMPQFARAFGCRDGAPLNPKQRCRVW
ncbi:membrane metallo-endopeptidase-like 1 [Ixodes scapularis]